MDDQLWILELESVLMENDCSVNEIYSICRGIKTFPDSLRDVVWQVCLDVRNKQDQLSQFNEIYDLPFQQQLRHDCHNFVENLGNDDQDKVSVISDLESILTFYCKNRNLTYESNNGWIELLLPLLSLKLRRSETYNLFETIRDSFIPKGNLKQGNVYNVFRLLILYHDPDLCAILDTKRITPDMYALSWFQSLFASTCILPVVMQIWDLYFQQSDPFLVFFLSLIMLVNRRETIIAMKNEDKETIIQFLSVMPCELEADDVIDFCSLAQYYSTRTPTSFKTEMLNTLFGTQTAFNEKVMVSHALCLPVSVHELIENASDDGRHIEGGVRFFLVDCRPVEHYNWGHLPTAFHLDSNLMLTEPASFQTAVQGLMRAQRMAIEANSNAGGEHLCFLGSGKLEEDQYTHMVVASFLQKGTQYVSILTGGYAAIHDYFGESMLDCLEDHDLQRCLICNKNEKSFGSDSFSNQSRNMKLKNQQTNVPSTSKMQPQKQSFDLFSKLSSAMKGKTAEVKGKLIDYIVNPAQTTSGSSGSSEMAEKHVAINEKNGKRYRNLPPVFGLYEGVEGGVELSEDDGDEKETVNIQSYLKNNDIIKYFKCQEVQLNGAMYESYLILLSKKIEVLREEHGGMAKIIVRRPLSSIVKITAKKRHRDLITFKYGIPDGDNLIITDMDRFLIPNANEATKIISKYILQQL